MMADQGLLPATVTGVGGYLGTYMPRHLATGTRLSIRPIVGEASAITSRANEKKYATPDQRRSLLSQSLGSENTIYVSPVFCSEQSAIFSKIQHSLWLQSGLLFSALTVETSYRPPRAAQRTFCSVNVVALKTEVSEQI